MRKTAANGSTVSGGERGRVEDEPRERAKQKITREAEEAFTYFTAES